MIPGIEGFDDFPKIFQPMPLLFMTIYNDYASFSPNECGVGKQRHLLNNV
jgi:hypothetical protein